MANWVAVHGLADAETVEADTFNRPYFELAERTNYLYGRLQMLAGDNPFDSVRLFDVPLDTNALTAPVVGDVVYLDPVAGVYTKAIASIGLLDEFIAAQSAFAIGVLIGIVGATGTVLTQGRLPLQDSTGAPWLLSGLLETDEPFRNGQYYLSSREPGKLTAYPSGPLVYVGYFMQSTTDALYGDYAIMSPQYRDTGESHVHRSFMLHDQPAGRQAITGETPEDTVYAVGFYPDTIVPGDWQPRLLVTGTWTGGDATQYTCWLSTSAGTTRASSSPPTDFTDAYLHWLSGDSVEGQGKTRIWSFESPVAIGTKGLMATLENPGSLAPIGGFNWETVYQAASDNYAERTWTFTAPTETKGWLARRWRQYFTGYTGSDNGFSLMLMGGPHIASDLRSHDTISAKCAEVHTFELVLPTAHDTTEIDSTVYEYTDDGSATAGNIPVVLTGNILSTYENLLAAILGSPYNTVTPVLDSVELSMVLGTLEGTTVTHLGAVIAASAAGAGNVTVGASTASLLVYDKDNHNLVTNYGSLYWGAAEYWQFVSLSNGLQVLVIPFSSTGAAKTADAIEINDYWECDIADQAVGANFMYAVGMDTALNQMYPPVPAKAASFMRNGVELSELSFSPDNPAFCLGTDTLHWYSDLYGTVPWPYDWADTDNPGASENQQDLRIHFVKNTIGDSGYVTSIKPAPGSPIQVLKCGTGDPGTVGDLELDLKLNLTEVDTGLAGYKVVKAVKGNSLFTGPVVEKIIAGPGLILTQNAGAGAGQGTVTISTSSTTAYQGDFEEISLLNAKQEMIGMFPYIKLNGWTTGGNNIDTGFTLKFRVPHTIANVAYRVVIYATVFGERDIPWALGVEPALAGLTFTYSILPDVYSLDPTLYPNTASLNLQEQLLEPAAAIQTTIPFGNTALTSDVIYRGFDPILVHNSDTEGPDVPNQRVQALGSPFPNVDDFPTWVTPSTLGVRPGSLVAVRFNRAGVAAASEYTGPLGFINIRWLLITV